MNSLSSQKWVDHHFTSLWEDKIQEITSKTFQFGNNFIKRVNFEQSKNKNNFNKIKVETNWQIPQVILILSLSIKMNPKINWMWLLSKHQLIYIMKTSFIKESTLSLSCWILMKMVLFRQTESGSKIWVRTHLFS